MAKYEVQKAKFLFSIAGSNSTEKFETVGEYDSYDEAVNHAKTLLDKQYIVIVQKIELNPEDIFSGFGVTVWYDGSEIKDE